MSANLSNWYPERPPPCPRCGAQLRGFPLGGAYKWYKCATCLWEVAAQGVNLTVATAPWTRTLWAEIERLRLEAEELRLTIAAEQGRQEGAPSEGWVYDPSDHSWRRRSGKQWWAVERDWSIDDGRSEWSGDRFLGGTAPNMRAAMKAADEAEAAAKEPTP